MLSTAAVQTISVKRWEARRLFSLAECPGDQRRAARGQHDGKPEDEIDGRIDDVRGRQGLTACIPADENAIGDGIERDHEHHADRRRCESQQRSDVMLMG